MVVEAKNETGPVKIKGVKFIKSFSGIDEYQLDNGLKILLKENDNSPSFAWQVWYKVGSRNEQPGLTGIAHYLEHIMFKGTDDFRKGEISQIIQLQGGIFNAFTGDDYTAYFENFSPENLELAIKLEADRMQGSRLDTDEVELERSVIVSELEGNRNNPHNIMYENLRSLAYQVHSYRNPVIGWREDLDNINSKNMRQFYETYYYPDNAVAILVGNFDPELALDLINRYFAKYKPRTKDLPKLAKEPEQKSTKRAVIKNGGTVKLLGMAFHIPEFEHEDSPALQIISDVVFSGMASRLYPKLVDAGLVTGVSGVAESSIDPGIFRIMATINPEAAIEEVEKIIDAELEDIKKNITEEELRIAKAREESSFVYQRDGAYDEALQIGYFEAISDWTKYARWVDEINAVTVDKVKEVAAKYFKPSNKSVVQLLPEETTDSLISLENNGAKLGEANYGAATLEPLDPKKLKRLLKIAEPKYSKGIEARKLKLDFNELDMPDQGVNLFFKEDHSLPLIYLNAFLFAGSANDAEKPGLAYLTSGMLARGSKQKDKYEIAKLTDLYGADLSFKSGKETAQISFSTITKNLDPVLEILSEILSEPRFDPEELERLKQKSITGIKQEDDYPRKVADRELARLIYPEDHLYYAKSIDERVKALEAITIEDVKKFYAEHYNINNLYVSVVGDLDEVQVKEIYSKIFSKMKTGDGNQAPSIAVVEAAKAIEKPIIKDDKSQVEISMGHACSVNRMSEDFHPLYIANYALGGSALSSRLGTTVRDENGLVYNVRSSFASSLGAGSYKVILGCNPQNVSKAISITKDTIKEFLKEGISESELQVAKSYLIGSFAVRTLASNDDITDTLSQMQVYSLGNDYIKTYAEKINSISLEQVNAAARRHIHPEKLHAVIVGPSFK